MTQRYGTLEHAPATDAFTLSLSLNEGPLDLVWHHCSMTSEFLGEIYARRRLVSGGDFNEARHGIGYLVNELLENAVKFRAPGTVEVDTALADGRFSVRIRNRIDVGTAARFKGLLEEIVSRDPGELLIERIEANALAGSTSGSGLGLLTLMNDYGVELGWIFTPAGENTVSLETNAALNLP